MGGWSLIRKCERSTAPPAAFSPQDPLCPNTRTITPPSLRDRCASWTCSGEVRCAQKVRTLRPIVSASAASFRARRRFLILRAVLRECVAHEKKTKVRSAQLATSAGCTRDKASPGLTTPPRGTHEVAQEARSHNHSCHVFGSALLPPPKAAECQLRNISFVSTVNDGRMVVNSEM
jgi:hypothetical protein